jgi:hypothetical protein
MSDRIQPDWIVRESIEHRDASRCVDLFERPDGTFGFEEFRRDVEDEGRWTGIAYLSVLSFASEADALAEATRRIHWLDEQLRGS